MYAYFLAEKLKYRHTVTGKLMIGMPLISTAFAAALTYEYFTIDSYNWWYMTLFPAMIALVCGIIGGKDLKLKNRSIWSLPCDMGRIWDAKILVGTAASGISVLCIMVVTIGGGVILKAVMDVSFAIDLPVFAQLAGCLLIWLTSLWQVPVCLLLSQKIGLFPMMLVHMACNFMASVFAALEGWFPLAPWAITPRLMCTVMGILPNGLPAVPGQETYSPELIGINNLLIGIPAAVIWFLLFWKISRCCFKRQVV